MSTTPRTDAAEELARLNYEMSRECGYPPYPGGDLADFARGLEEELAQLTAKLVRCQKVLRMVDAADTASIAEIKALGIEITDREIINAVKEALLPDSPETVVPVLSKDKERLEWLRNNLTTHHKWELFGNTLFYANKSFNETIDAAIVAEKEKK